MKPVRRALPALVLALFAGATVPAAGAAQFSNVVVFGDSLSDAGYYRPFLSGLGLPSSVVATLGRFTTNPGPVWSELVAGYYGASTAPSNAGGSIFAQGGATVATNSPSTPPGFAQRPVSTQITEYLARSGGSADPDALHAVWAGGNDFLNNFTLLGAGTITQAQFQTNLLAAAGAEVQQVGRLYAAGARYVMVFALPNLGITPFAIGTGAANAASATAASAGYNTTLYTGLVSAGLRAIPVDVFTLLNEIKANPAAYGFSNTTGIACGPFPPITTSGSSQFCGPTNLVAAGADQSYLFADGVHPTTGAHRIVADFATSLIEGPTAYSMLGEVALRTRAAHVQTLADGLALGQASKEKIAAFASVSGGSFEVESRGTEPQFDSDNRAYSVGVTMRASEAVTVGVALGRVKSDGAFGNDLGGFRSSENVASILRREIGRLLRERRGEHRQPRLLGLAPQHPPGARHARRHRGSFGRQLLGLGQCRLRLHDRQARRRADARLALAGFRGERLRRKRRRQREPAHRRAEAPLGSREHRHPRVLGSRVRHALREVHRRQGAQERRSLHHRLAALAHLRQFLRHPGLPAGRLELGHGHRGGARHAEPVGLLRPELLEGHRPRRGERGFRHRHGLGALLTSSGHQVSRAGRPSGAARFAWAP
ncbi:MAG: SGNH/GDSL hydrolase family protein [Betaproteobacteria bacterium]|nr:SGNH/GDSL hydrolase family protein [Betaproteobacteria bacterium]